MKPSGYSGTPLAKKLGIKKNFRIRLINTPANYFQLFSDFPSEVDIIEDVDSLKHFIHFFTSDAKELSELLPDLKKEIFPDGMIWVSWPKKISKVKTDLNEDLIRELAIKNGLVDVKVCAVDEVWSGLKLVIPVKDREQMSKTASP